VIVMIKRRKPLTWINRMVRINQIIQFRIPRLNPVYPVHRCKLKTSV
jgi:hypothetical protein